MLKVFATLASLLIATSAFGQSPEMETVIHDAGAACVDCPPSCWNLNLSIPKRPIRTWLGCSEGVQKCVGFFSYKPAKCGSCGLRPDVLYPRLYWFFWPVHCANGTCGAGCAPQGIWNESQPPVAEGFASAGVPVGAPQATQTVQAPVEEPWYKSMLGRKKDTPAPTPMVVPVSHRR